MISSSSRLNASASVLPSRERGDFVQVPQKRPRPVLSCVECRRKKLKCDRLLPCEQCRKASQSAQCTYSTRQGPPSHAQHTDESESETGQRVKRKTTESKAELRDSVSSGFPVDTTPTTTTTTTAAPVANEKVGVLEDLQSRVDKLERLLFTGRTRILASAQDELSNPVEQSAHALLRHPGILSIKGSRSRYQGPNHKITLLYQFEDAKSFIQKSFNDPGMTAIIRELQLSQKAFRKKLGTVSSRPLHDGTSVISKMLEVLPPRHVCDKLVEIYLNNFENVLRVFHIPTFLRECEHFWETRATGAAYGSEFTGFIPQLIIVLAIASSLDDSDTLTGGDSEGTPSAAMCCGLVQAWLDGLGGKQRIDFSTLRTQILLLLARQTRSTRVDEMWNATGLLVRSAMTMGLHRDPAESSNISVFEGEQKRRLWMTIVEMDLQTSLTYGMPSMVRQCDFNCRSPANIDDQDLFEDMSGLLASKPFEEYTDSLSQVALVRSLPLRLEAVNFGSNTKLQADYGEVLKLGRKLEEFLQDLPAPLKFDHVSMEGNERPGRLFGRVLLDVYLRRALLCLYRPFTLDASGGEIFAEARRACIRSSLILLSHQDVFDPDVADLDVINSKKYWDLFHVICKDDIMQAALGVCLEIKMMSRMSATNTSGMPPVKNPPRSHERSVQVNTDERVSTWTKANLTRTVENILESLVRRINEFGSDFKDSLCLSIVLQSVRTRSSHEKEALMREGITSFIRLCRQRLLQEGGVTDKRYGGSNADLRSTGPSPSGPELVGSEVSTYQSGSQNGVVPPPIDFSQLLEVDMDAGALDFGSVFDWDFGQF